MSIRWVGSPNFMAGRAGKVVDTIVLHHSDGTLAAADATFQNKTRDTSAHYGIGRNGEVHQYVHETDTAFHAGVWSVNLRSIGIEHEDLAKDDYTDLEYETSANLIATICKRYSLNETNLHRHNEFKATACPGSLDVERLKVRVHQLLDSNPSPAQDIYMKYPLYQQKDQAGIYFKVGDRMVAIKSPQDLTDNFGPSPTINRVDDVNAVATLYDVIERDNNTRKDQIVSLQTQLSACETTHQGNISQLKTDVQNVLSKY